MKAFFDTSVLVPVFCGDHALKGEGKAVRVEHSQIDATTFLRPQTNAAQILECEQILAL
jgi:hypothetical protein